MRVWSGLPYVQRPTRNQRLDLYVPSHASDVALPLLVYLHPGGWREGSRSTGFRRLKPFLDEGPFAGASLGYRKSTEAKWPAQIEDVQAAVHWLRENAARFGVDGARICLIGHSAGGHLALMHGLRDEAPTAGVVAVAAPTSFLDLEEKHHEAGSQESDLIGGSVRDHPERARDASPISHVHGGAPPTLLIHGAADIHVPLEQSALMHEALVGGGVDSTLVEVPGADHFLDLSTQLGLVVEFLRARLQPD